MQIVIARAIESLVDTVGIEEELGGAAFMFVEKEYGSSLFGIKQFRLVCGRYEARGRVIDNRGSHRIE